MPGFKTFSAAVLTVADVNDYLMEQAVIQCTSATRPGSPHEGMTIYETDTNMLRIYNGALWQIVMNNQTQGYTPVLTAATTNPTLGSGATAVGEYSIMGSTVHVTGQIIFGTAMNAGSGIYGSSLPVEAATSGFSNTMVGQARCYEAGGNTDTPVLCYLGSSTAFTMTFPALWPNATLTAVAHNQPFAWTQSDRIDFQCTYQAL
jgi:hypothetical protein